MNNQSTTVLYVDDSLKTETFLGGVRSDSGFKVITASDPLDALELCKQVSFDPALWDYEMHCVTSSQLMQEIQSLKPRVLVVFLTGQLSFPRGDRIFTDAHFGRSTFLDDLLETVWIPAGSTLDKKINSQTAAVWFDST